MSRFTCDRGDRDSPSSARKPTLEISYSRHSKRRFAISTNCTTNTSFGRGLTTIAVRAAARRRYSVARFIHWASTDTSQARSAGMDDAAIALRAAVQRLPDRVRVAVLLHHMVGFSVQETAAAMRVTENTVKSELKTGLSRLRETMR